MRSALLRYRPLRRFDLLLMSFLPESPDFFAELELEFTLVSLLLPLDPEAFCTDGAGGGT